MLIDVFVCDAAIVLCWSSKTDASGMFYQQQMAFKYVFNIFFVLLT